MGPLAGLPGGALPYLAPVAMGYAFGAVPFAYFVTRLATGEDVSTRGTGNVGAMNVRRATGSWAWFAVAMLLDVCKGIAPVLLARAWLAPALGLDGRLAEQLAVGFSVVGHNWPVTMLLLTGSLHGGKGLATGGGALFAYDWRYAAFPLAVALVVVAATRVLLAGQIAAPVALVAFVVAFQRQDLLFVCVLAAVVVYKHARRVPGLVEGREPAWNVTEERGRRNPG